MCQNSTGLVLKVILSQVISQGSCQLATNEELRSKITRSFAITGLLMNSYVDIAVMRYLMFSEPLLHLIVPAKWHTSHGSQTLHLCWLMYYSFVPLSHIYQKWIIVQFLKREWS
jgi:hypothetical protein